MEGKNRCHRPVVAGLASLDRHIVASELLPTLRSRRTVAGTRQPSKWELPAPSTTRPNAIDKDVLIKGEERLPIARHSRAIRPMERITVTAGGSTIGDTEAVDNVEMRSLLGQWAIAQIRDFGYFIAGVTQDKTADDPLLVAAHSMSWSSQSRICDLYLEYQASKNQHPPIAPIHGVIREATDSLQRLLVAMRRVLVRTRAMTPLPRVQAVDSACLAWLTRQPGRTHAERAGPRQRILAVCRTDTYDTYENRVLRAFLSLAIVACNHYLGDFGSGPHSQHGRVTRVREFKRIATDLLESEPMAMVNTLTNDSRPNYVLQFDPIYAPVWDNYLVLKAKRKQEDALWQWRHRSIGELFLLDLLASIHVNRDRDNPIDEERELAIRHDPAEGHWIDCPVGLDGAVLSGQPEVTCIPLSPLHHSIYARDASPLADASMRFVNNKTKQSMQYNFLFLVHDERPSANGWDRKDTILVMPDLTQQESTAQDRAQEMLQTGVLSWPDGYEHRQSTATAVIALLSANMLTNGHGNG